MGVHLTGSPSLRIAPGIEVCPTSCGDALGETIPPLSATALHAAGLFHGWRAHAKCQIFLRRANYIMNALRGG